MIVVLITISILLFGIFCAFYSDHSRHSWPDICSNLCLSLGGIALVIELAVILSMNANPIGAQAAMEAKRETLIYQMENETYKNDNNVGTTELFSSIAEYNGKVLKIQAGRKNPWTNWFYVPYGDDLELIDLEDYK